LLLAAARGAGARQVLASFAVPVPVEAVRIAGTLSLEEALGLLLAAEVAAVAVASGGPCDGRYFRRRAPQGERGSEDRDAKR